MSKFTLTIDTDNAAFQPDWTREVSRMLQPFVDSFSTDLIECGRLFDINGNECGRYEHIDTPILSATTARRVKP